MSRLAGRIITRHTHASPPALASCVYDCTNPSGRVRVEHVVHAIDDAAWLQVVGRVDELIDVHEVPLRLFVVEVVAEQDQNVAACSRT